MNIGGEIHFTLGEMTLIYVQFTGQQQLIDVNAAAFCRLLVLIKITAAGLMLNRC
jgi:hypothetical protein